MRGLCDLPEQNRQAANMQQNIVLVILLIIALALILIVLMQRSEGGGLGIGGGGGNMSGRPPASPLAKVTWALGIGFMAASLALTIIANNNGTNSSVLGSGDLTAPAAEEGEPTDSPLGGGSLLPPTPEAAPTQPPSSEN